MNRFRIRPEHWSDFEERFRTRESQLAKVPGFVRNMVLRPVEGGGEHHVVMTIWRSRADFEAWTRSEAFRRAHARAGQTPKEWFAGPNQLEAFESVSDEEATTADS